SSVWIEGCWFFGYRLGFFRIFGQFGFSVQLDFNGFYFRTLVFNRFFGSWTLFGLFGLWTFLFGFLRNWFGISNIHQEKSVNKSIIAQFFLFIFFIFHRKFSCRAIVNFHRKITIP